MPAHDFGIQALQHRAALQASAAPASSAQIASSGAAAKDSGSGGSFFDELLDIINPLQHLPLIGTAYRALTGDKLDGFAKVAGDALYGGLWGAVGAAADVAYEAVTGKSVEQTALAWLDLSGTSSGAQPAADQPVRVAANLDAPRTTLPAAAPMPEQAMPQQDTLSQNDAGGLAMSQAEMTAFTSALADKGVSGETAQRALYAYRHSVAMAQAGTLPAADPHAVSLIN